MRFVAEGNTEDRVNPTALLMNRTTASGSAGVLVHKTSAQGTARPTGNVAADVSRLSLAARTDAPGHGGLGRLLAAAFTVLLSAQALSAVLMDISPPGTSAGVGLSPLNEFLAGGFGMGGSGSGGEMGAGISFDPATLSLRVEVAYGSAGGFSDLSGPAFAWYLHGPSSADRVGPVMVNLSPLHQFAADTATGGFLDGSVRLTQLQADALLAGLTYLNFYTPDFPGGEIRGQLVVTAPIPEPLGWPGVLLPLAFFAWQRFGPRTRAVLADPPGGGSGD